MSPEGDQELVFDLLEDQIYQDQVSLQVCSSEDVDRICLRSHLSHLEVGILLENYPTPTDSTVSNVPRTVLPNEVCSNIRLTLDNCLQLSLKKLHYDITRVAPCFSLRCPLCTKLHEVKSGEKSWSIHCSSHCRRIPPSESAMFWFKKGICLCLSNK